MLKYFNFDIVFREIPDEVTLAVNLSNCPHRCVGCHSPHLQQDIGFPLNEVVISRLLAKYASAITCVCFMGGDNEPDEVCRLASFVRSKWNRQLKTAWYSGCKTLKTNSALSYFNYIKLGAYIEQFGGLDKKTTNQRIYHISDGKCIDITSKMWK